MSTVTLSKPHCAITSAENPDGIASHAFTTALPEAHISLTLFATLCSFPVDQTDRHCEPTGRANARPMTGSAKQSTVPRERWIASSLALLAMTAHITP